MKIIDLTFPMEVYHRTTQHERTKIIRAMQSGLDDYDAGWIWSDFIQAEASEQPAKWDALVRSWSNPPPTSEITFH